MATGRLRGGKHWILLACCVAVANAHAAPGPLPSAAEDSPAARAERDRKALFNAVADSVVFVRCGDESIGSGFFVDAQGFIATNRHVIDCDDRVQVFLRNGEKYKARVVAKDAVYDLAILYVKVTSPVTPLVLADSDKVEVGDYAASVSHPVGGVWTFNEGLISNKYPNKDDRFAGIIQTQVPLQPGSSGGPMLNRRGQVVGVVTAKLKQGDNTGFCIQSNLVRRLMQELAGNSNAQLAVSGKPAGAEIHVDGERRGTLPSLITVPPGEHTVLVRHGGKSVQKKVSLERGAVVQMFVKEEELQ